MRITCSKHSLGYISNVAPVFGENMFCCTSFMKFLLIPLLTCFNSSRLSLTRWCYAKYIAATISGVLDQPADHPCSVSGIAYPHCLGIWKVVWIWIFFVACIALVYFSGVFPLCKHSWGGDGNINSFSSPEMPTQIQGMAVFERHEALLFSRLHEEVSADDFQLKHKVDCATAKWGNICPLEEQQTFKGKGLSLT